jgi:hypothetical protein
MTPSLLLTRSAALHPDTLSHLSLLLRRCILLFELPAGSAEFPVGAMRQRLCHRQANIPQIAFFDLYANSLGAVTTWRFATLAKQPRLDS